MTNRHVHPIRGIDRPATARAAFRWANAVAFGLANLFPVGDMVTASLPWVATLCAVGLVLDSTPQLVCIPEFAFGIPLD